MEGEGGRGAREGSRTSSSRRGSSPCLWKARNDFSSAFL